MIDVMKRFRDRVSEPLEELQERARTYWIGLNPRERLVLSILGGVTALLLSALILKETFGFFFSHETLTQMNIKNASSIQRLTGELANQRADMMKYERLVGRRPNPFALGPFIESKAQEFGVALGKIAPARPKSDADENEEWAEVTLANGVTLDRTLKFLQELEETIGLRIHDLSIKPQYADPTKLDVVFTIVGVKEL